MLNWTTTATLDSALSPGVRMHFKKFSAGRRAELELALSQFRAEASERVMEYNSALEPDEDPAAKRRNMARFAGLQMWLKSAENRHEKLATLRTYLKRIEGISIDGDESPTVEQFLAEAPEELADEAFEFIQREGKLPAAVAGFSESPTISPVPEGGATSSTSAEPVAVAA